MLLNLKEILSVAKENHFAIGAFNTSDLALVRAVVEQAEASNTPAILQFAPGEFKYATPYFFRYVTERLKASRFPLLCIWIMGNRLRNALLRYKQALPR